MVDRIALEGRAAFQPRFKFARLFVYEIPLNSQLLFIIVVLLWIKM